MTLNRHDPEDVAYFPTATLREELIVVAILSALGLAACDPACRARGQLVSVGGIPEVICSVKLHHTAGEEEPHGIPCRQVGARSTEPGASLVNLGHEFECVTIPGLQGQLLDVTVSCEGYEPYRSAPFEWQVSGYTCEPHDLGTLTMNTVKSGASSTDTRLKWGAAEQPAAAAGGRRVRG